MPVGPPRSGHVLVDVQVVTWYLHGIYISLRVEAFLSVTAPLPSPLERDESVLCHRETGPSPCFLRQSMSHYAVFKRAAWQLGQFGEKKMSEPGIWNGCPQNRVHHSKRGSVSKVTRSRRVARP